MPVTVLERDLYLRVIKNYVDPTITFEENKNQIVYQADVEEAQDITVSIPGHSRAFRIC